MIRIVALPAALFAAAMIALGADQSSGNKSEEPDSFDVEPPLLRQNLSADALPTALATGDDVARLEKQLERAKKSAADAEHLCKIGVLSKVEVEQRSLKVVRCESDLVNARLACAKADLAAKQSKIAPGTGTQADLQAEKAALAQLTEAAQVAVEKRERAELQAAEADLRRQQKLLKLGSAKKSDVDRAQEKLAEVKARKN
jgi:multidrug resistance efflux pump